MDITGCISEIDLKILKTYDICQISREKRNYLVIDAGEKPG